MWYVSKIVTRDTTGGYKEVDYLKGFTEESSPVEYIEMTDYAANQTIKIYNAYGTLGEKEGADEIVPFDYLGEVICDFLGESYDDDESEIMFGLNFMDDVLFVTTQFGSKLYDVIDYAGIKKQVSDAYSNADINLVYKYIIFKVKTKESEEYMTLEHLLKAGICKVINSHICIINNRKNLTYGYSIINKAEFDKLMNS
jgi:hypothetical protein